VVKKNVILQQTLSAMQFQSNPQLELALNFLQYTIQNIFLTGKQTTTEAKI